MIGLDKEVAQIAQHPTDERVRALKRIIPCATIKSILKQCGQTRVLRPLAEILHGLVRHRYGVVRHRLLSPDLSLAASVSPPKRLPDARRCAKHVNGWASLRPCIGCVNASSNYWPARTRPALFIETCD